MSKSIWDRFAPIYSLAMKSQKNIYDYMYSHIREKVQGKDVLELATGPGLIANCLHIVPNPEKVLSEIERVMKTGGLLIAPNFIERKIASPNLWQKLLFKLGVRFEHQWTSEQYKNFLESNGWKITASEVVPGRIDLMYVECVR